METFVDEEVDLIVHPVHHVQPVQLPMHGGELPSMVMVMVTMMVLVMVMGMVMMMPRHRQDLMLLVFY